MRKGTRWFLSILILSIVVVAAYRYYDYVINENFVFQVNTFCNPSAENCFAAADSTNNDTSFGQTPYEKVSITERYAPVCLQEHTCTDFVCPQIPQGKGACSIKYCTNTGKIDGEICMTNLNQ